VNYLNRDKPNVILIAFADDGYGQKYADRIEKQFMPVFADIAEDQSVSPQEVGLGADWEVILVEIYASLSFVKDAYDNFEAYKEFFKKLHDRISRVRDAASDEIERINYNTALSLVIGRLAHSNVEIDTIKVHSVNVIPITGGMYHRIDSSPDGYTSTEFSQQDFNIVLQVNEHIWINSIVESNGHMPYFKISHSIHMHSDFQEL
jgi:hypothetical protein